MFIIIISDSPIRLVSLDALYVLSGHLRL